ncbi:MAG: GNAT family N-acetyltransferase [Treponema sp.]|nr:GNAT family N-acetyltransferase [Treponema sp.]
MTFELTDELLNSIISALENQDQKFVVDAGQGILVEQEEADEENFYALPEWTSADGFSMRQQFAEELHSPMARTDLQAVLRSGKGVFRGFKDVLKSHPEVERKWYYFKNKALSSYIRGWYNSLCETWGLETLDYEVEETDNLIHDDFMFNPYDFEKDRDTILHFFEDGARLMFSDYPQEVGDCALRYWKDQFENADSQNSIGIICNSISNQTAGCIIFAPDTEHKTAWLTGFYVIEKFRGLGIATELLEQAMQQLKAENYRWAMIASSNVTQTISPLLQRAGFEQADCVYIADLLAD